MIASGTHPTAIEGDSKFTDKPRYQRIHEWLGDAGATPVCALHIHVGMPDAETAIRVFNGLRRHMPLLEALGANSPFRHGRDTGLASSRELTLRSWPRAGVPRAMADYEDFVCTAERLTRVAEVPDYTFHWWKVRPAPAPRDRRDPRAGHAALAAPHGARSSPRCTRSRATRPRREPIIDGPPPRSSTRRRFAPGARACARRCPTATTGCGPSRSCSRRRSRRARSAARELGCEAQLDDLRRAAVRMVAAQGVQRALCRDGDIETVLDGLVERAGRATAATAPADAAVA